MLYCITGIVHVSYFFSWMQIAITETTLASKMTSSTFSIFAELLQISDGASDRITLS